jgi:hypothetical protein
MVARFCWLIVFLNYFGNVGERQFDEEVLPYKRELIRCYAAFVKFGSQMKDVTPAFAAMFSSLSSLERFRREYSRNHPALFRAMLNCPVFQPFRAMLLHDEGWRALCDAINGMKQLHDMMPLVNPEAYFALYSHRRINDFQRAVDELLDDGHSIDDIQRSLTMCTNSLQSYERFTEQYAASHAAIVSAVMNIHLPFVPNLPM